MSAIKSVTRLLLLDIIIIIIIIIKLYCIFS